MEYQKGDHFIVEDLLDFSNDDVEALVEELAEGPDVTADVAQQNFSAESSSATAGDSCNFSGELCEPQYDELAELEWLSNFVEESLSSEDLQKLHLISAAGIKSNTSSRVISSNTLPTLKIKTKPIISTTIPSPSSSSVTNHTNSHTTPATSDPNILRPLPSKTRSKRSRSAAPSNWSSHLIPLSPTYPNPNPNYPNTNPNPNPNPNSIPLKKPKKKQFAPESLTTEGRRCLHCQTDKTPQWRTGPMGPKTLCNACGVRYKSGRLVPEYRPAASPTFIVSKHSNSHRKVLELRRQKEVELDHFDVQHQQLMIQHGTAPVRGQTGEDFLIHRSVGMDYRQLI